MDNTRQLVRRNMGYLVVLGVLLIYAHVPMQCGNATESMRALMDWISTWLEVIQ